jgi:hypothetical protein
VRKAQEKEEVALRRSVAVLGACLALVAFGGGTAMAEGGSTEIECVGDACQPLPPEPEDPNPGTLGVGPTNPPVKGDQKPKKHRKHRHGKGRHDRPNSNRVP